MLGLFHSLSLSPSLSSSFSEVLRKSLKNSYNEMEQELSIFHNIYRQTCFWAISGWDGDRKSLCGAIIRASLWDAINDKRLSKMWTNWIQFGKQDNYAVCVMLFQFLAGRKDDGCSAFILCNDCTKIDEKTRNLAMDTEKTVFWKLDPSNVNPALQLFV